MTVNELITKLQELPNGNLRVVIRGYEAGVDDVKEIETVYLKLNANEEWYYGVHEDVSSTDPFDEIAFQLKA